jgi:hypothetical protein
VSYDKCRYKCRSTETAGKTLGKQAVLASGGIATLTSNRTVNWLGSGPAMPDMVNKARSEHP